MDRTEEKRQEYKELQRRVKRKVSKAKQKAYDELYIRLDTREGEKDLYRLARQRDQDGKDVQQVRLIKDRDGRVLTSEESVQRRWKEYFEELMNEENEREKRVEGVNSVEQKVDKIRKDEVRKALKRMKSGKAVGPDDIPVEVWKCLGEAAVEFLTSLFNRVLESERMPEEWRRSVLVPIFKNKGDVQSCSNYSGITLMSHTMKLWERVVEARLRKVVEICEQQYGFMPRKSTTDAIFALRILMEKYRDGQRELHCVFVDLEKAYDRVPREELWYCMRKIGVAEKYVRVVQDMYERSRTVVRCAVGQTEEFKVEVGLHQGSALSPFLFAIVMDQLSEEVRQESPWTMMFADDIVICSESREQVEENLEMWRLALERRGMKVSRSKTEYMCVNEREGSGKVRLQGEEVKKVQEFKYLGSTVQSNGECGKEVKKRVQAGWNGWRKVSGVLCDRKISVRIKGKVYRTVVRPAMLYGLETVSLRKRQESELESQVESEKKEENLHQLYQKVRKMQEELDGRLSKTTDELKAVRERIKEKKQQRAKNSVVISTMVKRSKKQRPEEKEEEEEVKDGLPEYDEGRSEQAQGAATQFPVIIKENDVAYIPWSFLDLMGLIGRLPSIFEGAQKWITRFEEQTMGQVLALGDIKAILSQSLGKAKMIEIFQNVNLKKVAEEQIYDPRSFGPHRNSIWHSLRDLYPTWADPGRVEKIKMEEDESVAEFVLKLQKAWREEMGGAWDETAASQTLFRMMVKKALPMDVQDQLDTVVGTMAWPTFEANIIHYVELHRQKEREAKKAADSLVMQLHKAQLSELACNKQDIMEKKKEEKSIAKQAAVLVAQPVAPPVAQPALPMPQPAAMTQAMPIVPPQQMHPVYYASPPLTMYPPVQQYLPQNRGWGQGQGRGRGGGTFQQPMRGRAPMSLGKRGCWIGWYSQKREPLFAEETEEYLKAKSDLESHPLPDAQYVFFVDASFMLS
ncbi:hypothetical protein QTP70_034025, partial [Hemibagrus guttatus]